MQYNSDDIKLMQKAALLCDNSECGYRVGGVIVLDGKVILEGWNERLPGNTFCTDGFCIREAENLSGGKDIHKVCTIHAEALLIAQAARDGVSLKGTTLYITTFPCLICAKSITKSGISKIFYMSSYTGEDYSSAFFVKAGIEVIHIPEAEVWNG